MVQLKTIRQYLTAVCSSLCVLSVSSSFVWIAPLLVRLKKPNSDLYLTPDQSSWVVSLIEVGDLLSTIPAGFLIDKFGRKPVLLSTGPMFIVAWALILTTRSVGILYGVRVLQGLALGLLFTGLPLYLAEISEPDIRGALGFFFPGMWYLGTLYEYSVGPFVSYQELSWYSIAPPIAFLLTFFWFPESPYWLLMKGEEDEAGKSLAWLRGESSKEGVQTELKGMKEAMEEEVANKASWKDLVKTATGRKSLLIIHMVGMSYTMSGGTAMFSYANETFTKTNAGGLSPDIYTIIMGAVLLAFVPFAGSMVDKLGRRPVFLVSMVGGAICLGGASGFFYLKEQTDVDVSGAGWVPILTIIAYTVLIGAGVEAVFPILQAELFPNNTRGVASGASHFNMTIMSIICLKLYQVISDGVGLYFLYGLFAFFSTLGAILIYFFVPETKGKTFWEIQEMLGDSKNKKDSEG